MKTNAFHAKKVLALLFAALLPLVASAQTKVEIDGIWYNLTAGTSEAEVTYKGDSYDSYYDEYSGSITIPATVTYDGVAYSVTSIGGYAFYWCENLTSITIPEGVTSIGYEAFYWCTSLTAITLPESLTSIGESAFSCCESLTAITIPEGVTSTGGYAFANCSSLTAITLPVGLTSIGGYAFSGCSSLTAITIPEGVTSIEGYAFYWCENLTAITLPASLTSIGEFAFNVCSSLVSITLPEGVTSIGEGAFGYCDGLTSIVVAEGNKVYDSRGGCNAIIETSSNTLTHGCPATIIPASVTSIGGYAFHGCSSLTAINIPEGVTSIGEDAFSYCTSLTAITIPDGVTSIGTEAFRNCTSLTAITLPESVTSIGDEVFCSCSSLTTIMLPDGVTSIGDRAFYNCSSLTAVHISNIEAWCKIEFGGSYSNPLSYAHNLYLNGELVTNLVIPESVTSIGHYAFYNCSSLTSITLPEGVTSIGYSAFYGCSSLTAITIPEGVTSIGAYAFKGCSSLTAITCEAVIPPTIGSTNTFYNVNKSIPVYVPAGSIAAYQSAEYWNDFERFEAIKTSVSNITLSQSSIILTEGASITLTAIVTPEDADDTSVTWSSSNEDVAMVSSKGKVIALAAGTATITATANDGSGVSASCEVTVTPASYVVTFLIDGELFYTQAVTPGSAITLPETPTKEGYTFSGWGEVPETMPAKDVTIEGTFTINKYLVTFKIGDEVVAADSLEYKSAIVAPEAPTKEGYTFSGWSEVPETMPAEDITINGTFTINKYLVTFMVDDIVFASDSLEYGSTITLPSTPPTREGYTFSGWGEVAETVPANDVTYSAYYIANVYKVYYFVGSKLVNMVEVTYGEPIPEYIYEPTTEGDEFLGWIGDTYETMPAHDVTYTANIESGINQITIDNSQLNIYDLMGRKVTDTENLKGGIYIIDGKKVIIK